ncbi:protein SPT2 homolog isoform X2 [Armigeres subalbatus]
MAKRDPKAKKKIEKMLKVIKSANKSVLDDAIDQNDTALTLQGPEQPDEDDYGYTSNVASQLYQQLMDKYKNTPEEKKFKDGSKRVMSKEDMERAKARVKDALNRVEEEENAPRTRKRKDGGEGTTRDEEGASGSSSKKLVGPDRYDPEEERRKEVEAKAKEEAAKKKARRPAGPAPPDFATLLKLAEQKQLEPVKVEAPVVEKKKEPERLMTKKEKKEYEERQAYLEQKKIRDRIRNDARLSEKERQIKLAQYDAIKAGKVPPTAGANKSGASSTNVMAPNGRIPKLNSSGSDRPASSTTSLKPSSTTVSSKPSTSSSSSSKPSSSRPDDRRASLQKPSLDSVAAKSKLEAALTASKRSPTSQSSFKDSSNIRKPTPSSQQNGSAKISSASKPPQSSKPATSSTNNGQKTRPFPPADVPQKTRQFPPPDVQKPRQFPPADVQKTRQFPPPDVTRKRPLDARGKPSSSSSSAPFKKRRPVIEDSDSEYDSEMDDFIDDGDEEMDYSSQIKAIFGYDKSRYRDEDYDDRQMESSFAQQMREEFISKKIGLMEDLEDMRMEEEEKRQKALKKKQAAKRK